MNENDYKPGIITSGAGDSRPISETHRYHLHRADEAGPVAFFSRKDLAEETAQIRSAPRRQVFLNAGLYVGEGVQHWVVGPEVRDAR